MQVNQFFLDAIPQSKVMEKLGSDAAQSVTLNAATHTFTSTTLVFDETGWCRLPHAVLCKMTLMISSDSVPIEDDWPALQFSTVELITNHMVIENQPLFAGDLMSRFLYGSSDQTVKNRHCWEIPLHFSFNGDHVTPTPFYATIQLRLDHLYEAVAARYNWTCKCETVSSELLSPSWVYKDHHRSMFQMNHRMFRCEGPDSSFMLKLHGTCPCLCFGFFSRGQRLERDVLQRLHITTEDKYPIILVEDASTVHGKNPQQFPSPSPRPRRNYTTFDTKNTTVFPVEIWARIFAHLDSGPECEALQQTCKYLWNISHRDLIADDIHRIAGATLPGWYFIPFNTSRLDAYQGPTLHLTKVELRLEVEFKRPFSGTMVVFWVNYNLLHHRNGLYSLTYHF